MTTSEFINKWKKDLQKIKSFLIEISIDCNSNSIIIDYLDLSAIKSVKIDILLPSGSISSQTFPSNVAFGTAIAVFNSIKRDYCHITRNMNVCLENGIVPGVSEHDFDLEKPLFYVFYVIDINTKCKFHDYYDNDPDPNSWPLRINVSIYFDIEYWKTIKDWNDPQFINAMKRANSSHSHLNGPWPSNIDRKKYSFANLYTPYFTSAKKLHELTIDTMWNMPRAWYILPN